MYIKGRDLRLDKNGRANDKLPIKNQLKYKETNRWKGEVWKEVFHAEMNRKLSGTINIE